MECTLQQTATVPSAVQSGDYSRGVEGKVNQLPRAADVMLSSNAEEAGLHRQSGSALCSCFCVVVQLPLDSL